MSVLIVDWVLRCTPIANAVLNKTGKLSEGRGCVPHNFISQMELHICNSVATESWYIALTRVTTETWNPIWFWKESTFYPKLATNRNIDHVILTVALRCWSLEDNNGSVQPKIKNSVIINTPSCETCMTFLAQWSTKGVIYSRLFKLFFFVAWTKQFLVCLYGALWSFFELENSWSPFTSVVQRIEAQIFC